MTTADLSHIMTTAAAGLDPVGKRLSSQSSSSAEHDQLSGSAPVMPLGHMAMAREGGAAVEQIGLHDGGGKCTGVYATFSYEEVMSPRHQQNGGKRYRGGYLQHRSSMAGGFLKSWKKKYFRLRDHGLLCFKQQDDTVPLFEVQFKAHSLLVLSRAAADDVAMSPSSTRPAIATAKANNSSMLLVLKHVEVVGHQISASKVEVPIHLKAESEEEYNGWVESLQLKMEARRRALLQTTADAESANQQDQEAASEATVDKQANQPEVKTDNLNNTLEQDEMPTSELKMPSPTDKASPSRNHMLFSRTQDPPEFQSFRAKYLLMKEIGEGSFSIVHKAVNRLNGRLCAVKCCKYSPALEDEVALLRKLSHPNIVGIEGVYHQDDMYYVVMDYMNDGDLCDLLIKKQRLSEKEVQRIILQVVQAIEYLHRHSVLHRDIKPENILLHGNAVKLADFGLAKQLTTGSSTLKRSCGTLEYAAPELLCGLPYGLKSDVFSLGIVMYVLLFGAFPFSIESAAALQCMDRFPDGMDVRDMSCLSRENIQWRSVSVEVQDVILKMLTQSENDRISAKDLLMHPWFQSAMALNDDTTVNKSGLIGKLGSDKMNTAVQECLRISDCDAKGFCDLLGRGLNVVKIGNKETTLPHESVLTIDFGLQYVSWTARSTIWSPSGRKKTVNPHEDRQRRAITDSKNGRVIFFDDIKEIRVGHATDAFSRLKDNSGVPAEQCISIICSWRTLDLVVQAPSQREFLLEGLQALLPEVDSPTAASSLAATSPITVDGLSTS